MNAYIIGPLIATIIFTILAVASDPKKSAASRLLFFLAALTSLLLTVAVSVTVAEWGEQLPATSLSQYTYNVSNGMLLSVNTTYSYVGISPVMTLIPNIYLVLITVLWLVFLYWFIQLLIAIYQFIARAMKWRGYNDDEYDS